jgi:hypothetical protein
MTQHHVARRHAPPLIADLEIEFPFLDEAGTERIGVGLEGLVLVFDRMIEPVHVDLVRTP